jgi:hypothetical protein
MACFGNSNVQSRVILISPDGPSDVVDMVQSTPLHDGNLPPARGDAQGHGLPPRSVLLGRNRG